MYKNGDNSADLNPVGLPLSFEPQSDRMSHRGWPLQAGVTDIL